MWFVWVWKSIFPQLVFALSVYFFSSQWCACEWKRLGSTICLSLGSRWQWHIKPVSKWMSSTKCPFQSPKNKMGPQTYSQNDKRDGSPVQNHLCMICDKAILQKFKSSVIHIIIDVTIWRIFAHSTVNSLQIFTQSDVWHLSYFLTLSPPITSFASLNICILNYYLGKLFFWKKTFSFAENFVSMLKYLAKWIRRMVSSFWIHLSM